MNDWGMVINIQTIEGKHWSGHHFDERCRCGCGMRVRVENVPPDTATPPRLASDKQGSTP